MLAPGVLIMEHFTFHSASDNKCFLSQENSDQNRLLIILDQPNGKGYRLAEKEFHFLSLHYTELTRESSQPTDSY